MSAVVITRYKKTKKSDQFITQLQNAKIPYFFHYEIDGYPSDVAHIVSENGFGQNDYITTTRPLVVVTAPGPGSGKMATCLSQLYHDNERGICSGYAKFETFPVWNLPLSHSVNLAYESATLDINDNNMIDPFHLESYGRQAVNYNRDIEVFPVLQAIFQKIYGKSPYNSPTDMGVNSVGFCLSDEKIIENFSKNEIIRRYFSAKCDAFFGKISKDAVKK